MAKSKELADFRAKHFKELKKTIDVLIAIRDDPGNSAKDRIEASKSIGRMLSAMSPAKAGDPAPGNPKKGTIKKPELPAQLKEQLARLIQNGTTRT